MPSPVYSNEFEVMRQALPIPPVAMTIDFALKITKRPCSRQYPKVPETLSPSFKKRAPLFEFTHALRRLLGMNLGHAPVVQKLATAHRVAKMSAPGVSRVDIGHRRGDSAFGHHRVRFAEE